MTNKRQKVFSCSIEAALNMISGKWKLPILNQLTYGPKRYSDLRRNISGITEKMLTQQLRELEEDGLINRKIYPVVPPKVEYSFTGIGTGLKLVFAALSEWGNNFDHLGKQEQNADRSKNCRLATALH